MTDIQSMLPERVRNVDLYDPQRPAVRYDLSDNTNQWPLCDDVKSLLVSGDVNISRYPEVYGRTLKEKLADFYSAFAPTVSGNIVCEFTKTPLLVSFSFLFC